MVIGAMLLLTIIFLLLGILFGFVVFIMFIVGLVTSSSQNITFTSTSNVGGYGQPTQEQKTIVLAICPNCKSRVPAESKFSQNVAQAFEHVRRDARVIWSSSKRISRRGKVATWH